MLNPATTLILNITIIAILYFSSFQIWRGDLSKGQLIAIINYISQMLLAIIVFSNLIMIYTRAYTSAIRVKSVLDIKLQDDKYEEVKEALNVGEYNMIVTPKEIDDLIENMKDIVARGINFAI